MTDGKYAEAYKKLHEAEKAFDEENELKREAEWAAQNERKRKKMRSILEKESELRAKAEDYGNSEVQYRYAEFLRNNVEYDNLSYLYFGDPKRELQNYLSEIGLDSSKSPFTNATVKKWLHKAKKQGHIKASKALDEIKKREEKYEKERDWQREANQRAHERKLEREQNKAVGSFDEVYERVTGKKRQSIYQQITFDGQAFANRLGQAADNLTASSGSSSPSYSGSASPSLTSGSPKKSSPKRTASFAPSSEGDVIKNAGSDITGRHEGGVFKDEHGRIVGRAEGGVFKDEHGAVIGRVEGGVIKDENSEVIGRVEGGVIKDKNSDVIGRIEG